MTLKWLYFIKPPTLLLSEVYLTESVNQEENEWVLKKYGNLCI